MKTLKSFLKLIFWLLPPAFMHIVIVSCQQSKVEDSDNLVADTNKVIELINLELKYATSNPKLALKYGNEANSLAKSIDFKTGYAKGLLHMGQVYMKANDYVIAKRYFNSALKYSRDNELNNIIPICLGSLGIVSENLCNYPESISYYTECQKVYTEINDTTGIIKCKINIGNVYKAIGQRSKAVSVLLDALKIAEAENLKLIKSACLNNLSTLYQEMGKNDESLEFLLEVEEISKSSGDSINLANAYNNLGITYQALKNNELALQYYLQAADIKYKIKDKYGLSISLNNIGALRFDAKDYPAAYEYFNKAYLIAAEIQDLRTESKYLKNMSDALVEMEKFNEALDCLNKSLSIATSVQAQGEKVTALYALSEAYIKMKDYKQGYEFYKSYSELNDSLDLLQNNLAVEEMKNKYESDKKELQINKLEKEKELAKTIQLLLIGLAILIITIGILIFLWQRNKAIKNRQNAEYQQSLMEEKLTVSKLEQQNLQQTIEFKEKELINLALFIIQKIEFIEILNNELKTLQKDAQSSKAEIVNKLSQLISTNLKIDKERSEFQIHIDKTNQLFFKKLKDRFPTITENEKKLSAMLRINLSSKDIASILNISPSSVDMSRYRLRKKLNLSNDESIVDFLNSI